MDHMRRPKGLSKEGLRAMGGEEEGRERGRTGGSSSSFFTVDASCVSEVKVVATNQPLSLSELWTFCI